MRDSGHQRMAHAVGLVARATTSTSTSARAKEGIAPGLAIAESHARGVISEVRDGQPACCTRLRLLVNRIFKVYNQNLTYPLLSTVYPES